MSEVRKLNFISKKAFQNFFVALSFPVVIFLLLYLNFRFFGFYLNKLIQYVFGGCFDYLFNTVFVQNMPEAVQSFLFLGIFKSIAAFFLVSAYVCVWFLFIAYLKESNYFKIVANATGFLFKHTGISVSDFYNLLTGFGCCACVRFNAKNIKEKMLLYFFAPFFSCSAKFPFYILFSFVFPEKYREPIVFCLYFFGVVTGGIITVIINKLFVKNVQEVPFESDCGYKTPNFKNILSEFICSVKNFVKKVFAPIVFSLIFVWFLINFNLNFHFVSDISESIAVFVGRILKGFIQPFGVYDSKISTLFFAGFFSKEVLSMFSFFNGAEEILYNYKKAAVLIFMVFCLISTPCFAMIINVKREIGLKFALLLPVFQCILALIISYLFYFAWLALRFLIFTKPSRLLFIC